MRLRIFAPIVVSLSGTMGAPTPELECEPRTATALSDVS